MIYLAGPMSGIPQFNFPLFNSVTATLRERGYKVVSPVETDTEKMRELAYASPDGDPKVLLEATDETWGEVLANDVRIIADDISSVVLLPGWENSKGARLEAFVAHLCEHHIFYWRPDTQDIHLITRCDLLTGIIGVTL